MTQTETYADVLYEDTHSVLGRRLAPYTVGHELLLTRLRSPFVTGARLPGVGDLKAFLAICSRSYPRALAITQSSWLPWILRMQRCPRRRLAEAVMKIIAYLNASRRAPQRWEKEGGKSLGTCVVQQIKLTLMKDLGKTEMQALCTPFALAFHDCMSVWEMEGAVELVDPELIEELERLDAGKPEAINNRVRFKD